VVDERTALENQILGTYEELDRDMQLLVSVRAAPADEGPGEQPLSRARQKAIQARRTRLFNRDDVDELKRAGCLGEAKDGKLAARACKASSDAEIAARIERILASENEARFVILEFVVQASPDLTVKDLPQVIDAHVRTQRENARPGEWIQLDSGEWVQKD